MIVEECSTVWLTDMSLSIRSSIFKEVWFPLPIRLPQMKHLDCCCCWRWECCCCWEDDEWRIGIWLDALAFVFTLSDIAMVNDGLLYLKSKVYFHIYKGWYNFTPIFSNHPICSAIVSSSKHTHFYFSAQGVFASHQHQYLKMFRMIKIKRMIIYLRKNAVKQVVL